MNENNGHPKQRRVVVTGLGAVSSNGVGIDEFWNATRSGKSGIDTITSFDPESLSCRIAGEVKNFKPADYLAPRELKRGTRGSSGHRRNQGSAARCPGLSVRNQLGRKALLGRCARE